MEDREIRKLSEEVDELKSYILRTHTGIELIVGLMIKDKKSTSESPLSLGRKRIDEAIRLRR